MKARALFVAVASALLLSASLYAAEAIKLEGVNCVVAKKAAKAENAVAYKGGKVFFCCQGCPKKFKGETANFATKANAQLAATGQAKQAKCPLTGKDLNPATAITVGGSKVAFCCNGCKGKVAKAEGDAQLELVFSEAAFKKAGYKVGKGE